MGFATVEQAEAARKYYDKSYMDAMRIQVEYAYPHGSDRKCHAWSKYTEGTSAYKASVRRPDAPEKEEAVSQRKPDGLIQGAGAWCSSNMFDEHAHIYTPVQRFS